MKSATEDGLFEQMAAVLATGNHGIVDKDLPKDIPASVAACFSRHAESHYSVALVEGDASAVAATVASVAELPGPIVSVHAAERDEPLAYHCDWLLEEVSTSINTTAAGGNASLMMMA
jgi:RHH-type proline utilization regulon transcriptional repressor/proline dehydrogenase/delta 1-pyrroline-5-carboxylate dehydrogenase